MAKENLTELVFILDKSGSMAGLVDDTIGGYNALLEKNREAEGEALVSTVLFDNSSEVLHDRVDIAKVKPLTRKDYPPGGCTALLDAVGGAIAYHQTVRKILPAELHPAHTLFCITTDGYENASCRYDYKQVKRMIEASKERGWEFMFLGANIDVAAEAGKLGIDADCAVAFEASVTGCAMAYDELCMASMAVRDGRGAKNRRA
ncbi:hypothetical protein [Paratractidigestivibacter sp.]|uniref:vWA domain-containing protein n=1 Tax=Paratractidigestivibacter sp. TaxID=2847316 RepID=UPI002ABE8CA5|nr:hypothetical protein [Paratractidigestivibacter sp.]